MSKPVKNLNEKQKKNITIKEEVSMQDVQLSVEEQYKKKTLHQHILDRPGMYIGPIKSDKINMYIYCDEINGIIRKDINIVLGLYKIFDEILVNAADHTTRDKGKCNRIDVYIDSEKGTIEVKNNGTSVPIEFHKDEQMYVPEMIFGNLLTSGNYNDDEERLVGGTNGLGSKCLDVLTKIILIDGSMILAKDVKLGDKLIGDDGLPRTVLRTTTGTGQMYEIIQANGESYTVNDNHTLTLHMPEHKVIFWNNNGYSMLWWNHKEQCLNSKFIKAPMIKKQCQECGIEISSTMKIHYERLHKDKKVPKKVITKAKLEMEEFAKTIPDNNIIDINIQDYMKLNKTTKKRLAGIRGECVQWKKQDVQMDPYVLGLWLGDEHSIETGNTCNEKIDHQIIDYLKDWSVNNDVNIKQLDNHHYSLTSLLNKDSDNSNLLKKQLEKYNLINNKHIPLEYIVNDRETRLKVLAGIIDTNGIVQHDGKGIIITQEMNHEQLVKDIILLSRSLGFYTCSTIKDTTWTWKYEQKTGNAYNINISGDIQNIPTLLPKNKCSSERHDSIKTTGYLTVKDAGIGDYIGFTLDGNQKFVINDFTVTHNCANVYSDWFDIEIQDTIRHKKYYQRFSNNMYNKNPPVITELPKTCTDSYTKFIFLPDYKRFGLNKLTDDHIALFKRRVYDVAGTTSSNVKVYYNNEYIDIKTFEDYIKLFYTDRDENDIKLVYQDFNERWSIGVVYDPSNEFRHMTFVNKISTYDGGTHLNYIIGQIVDKVTNSIVSQAKYKSLKIKPAQVKDNLTVFINTNVENPTFGSQTKDSLKTKASDFKIKCEIDDKFITKICKSGLLDEIVEMAQFKQLAELDKSAKKVTNLKKLIKLEDARFAGSKQGHKCTLILTEGDSAKKFAVDAFDVIGRDYFGVFPLKGKLLNVREATINQLLNNEEIINLMQILGLDRKKTYKNNKGMRYGHILLLTDQDLDGSHIKGLIINFIHTFWPSLVKIDGFIQSIATPIVKIFKKSDPKKIALYTFYTMTEYKKWCEKNTDTKNYEVKYYKGLATSTDKEAIETFNDYENKIINYIWNKEQQGGNRDNEQDEQDELKNIDASDTTSVLTDSNDKNEPSYQAITLAFAKKRSNDRKIWLKEYDPDKIIENSNKNVTFDEFVEYDLKHFSIYDNIRSIPDICDGLKPSQRKILYGAIKRKLENGEIKVAQLSGYISEHTGYHHGEASLQGAIVNMAQDFCGSNNINIFKPNGNFGSRSVGGKDAGSARYIFTQLNKVSKLIFNDKDTPILDHNDDEGDIVEPRVYYPIIPMILVNGSEGIGTGYSTSIPQYNPLDLIKNIKDSLNGKSLEELDELIPWYRGFIGKIEKKPQIKSRDKASYNVYGVATILTENTVRIKELPIGVWTDDYKKFLEAQREDGTFIVDYVNNSSNCKIDILITFANGQLQYLIKNNLIFTRLKLISSISIENMHLYKDNVITKYKSANGILKDYIKIRLDAYESRKTHGIKILANEMQVLKYRKKYIEDILDKRIIIERVTKSKLLEQIVNNEYPELSINLNSNPSYDYLLSLPLTSLTTEKINDFNTEYNEKEKELEIYKNSTIYNLWLEELDEFEKIYSKWLIDMEQTTLDSTNKKTKNSKTKLADNKGKNDEKKTESAKVIVVQDKKAAKNTQSQKKVKKD